VEITRRMLFEGDRLQILFFEARNVSDKCGDVERQDRNLVVLPLSGVFAKHDAPRRHVVGTPSHAVFFAAEAPYRLSYPDAMGDQAVILRFDSALAPDEFERRGEARLASSGLLGAEAMVLRSLLCAQLKQDEIDPCEIESRGIDLLQMSLDTMRPHGAVKRGATEARRARAVARVKEAVAAAPAKRWSIDRLAQLAAQSPYHLCRVFREQTGSSVYDYVLRERLAATLPAVLDGEDLTRLAHDAGFASHSHFTARFRGFFGVTPLALRRRIKASQATSLRKIMTAPQGTASVQ
jgi:AraC family transcriptional regulator